MGYKVCKIYNKSTDKLLGFTEFNNTADCFGIPVFRRMKDLRNYWKQKNKKSKFFEGRFKEINVIIKSHFGQMFGVIKWNNVQGEIVYPMHMLKWKRIKKGRI